MPVCCSRIVGGGEASSTAAAQPGVEHVEAWMFRSGTALRSEDDTAGERVSLRALPPGTELFEPTIVEGRWLLPEDEHAIVLNNDLAARLGLAVGQTVTFDFDDLGKQEGAIVGTVFDLSNQQSTAYAPRDVFARDAGLTGRTSTLQIRTTRQDAAFEQAVADRLRAAFEARGIRFGGTFTGAEGRRNNQSQFDILVTLLLVMSSLIAIVGSIGLAGTPAPAAPGGGRAD